MNATKIIGACGSAASLTAFVPQVVKVWQTHQTHDLSLGTLGLLLAGAVFWVTYGILRKDWAIWFTNSTIGILTLILLLFKLHFG